MPKKKKKLRTMLTEMGIKWQDKSLIYPEDKIIYIMNMYNLSREIADVSIYRTRFDAIGCHYSVICGYGTYGGEEGLLCGLHRMRHLRQTVRFRRHSCQ